MFGGKRIKKLEDEVEELKKQLKSKSECTCSQSDKIKDLSKRVESNNQRIVKNKKLIDGLGERI